MDFAGTFVSPFSVQPTESNPFSSLAIGGLDTISKPFASVGTTLGEWDFHLNGDRETVPQAFDVSIFADPAFAQVGLTSDGFSTSQQSIEVDGGAIADLQVGEVESSDPLLAPSSANSQSIVFVDSSVPDYQSLIAGLSADSDVVIIQPGEDGVATITETLAFYDSVSAIHLVTHGNPGAIQLGNTTLSTTTLEQYADQLQSWQEVLTADADLLIYGCNVAADAAGVAFAERLSSLTGADVAASDDLTGSAALGGDWNLEFNTGWIENFAPFSTDSLSGYSHALDVVDDLENNINGFLTSLKNNIIASRLPIVGKGLESFTELWESINLNFTEGDLDSANLLGSLEAKIEAATDLELTFIEGSDLSSFKFNVSSTGSQTVNIPLDLGFDFFRDKNISPTFGYNINFGIGVSGDQVKFDFAQADELSITLSNTALNIPDLMLDLGLLQFSATSTKPVNFDGSIVVDLKGDSNSNLSIDARLNSDLLDGIDTKFELETSFGDYFPSVTADLLIGWQPGQNLSLGNLDIKLQDIAVDLGSVATQFLNPIGEEISKLLEPIQPVIDFLSFEIPGIDFGFVEILNLVDGFQGTNYGDNLAKFIEVYEGIQLLSNFANSGSITLIDEIDFADFLPSNELFELDEVKLAQFSVPTFGPIGLPGGFADLESALGINLPLLKDPTQIFNLLIGQYEDVVLFDVDIEPLNIALDESSFPSINIPVWPVPPIEVGLGGELGFNAQFGFGFDGYGLKRYLDLGGSSPETLLDGFFIKDTSGVEINAAVIGDAGVGTDNPLFAAKLAATLGIGGEVSVTLEDTIDVDGRVHFYEIKEVTKDNPLCLFGVDGGVNLKIGGKLTVGALFLRKTINKTFYEVKLVDFSFGCEAGESQEAELKLAEKDEASGILYLNMGPRSTRRNISNKEDGDESFTVEHVDGSAGSEKVIVSAFGRTETFEGVTAIYAEGGKGNDIIDLTGVLSESVLWGDFNPDENDLQLATHGDDKLYASRGKSELHGGNGNDLLYADDVDPTLARTASAYLYGDGGDDDLVGGSSDDFLFGGSGNDVIFGNAGEDEIEGGEDDDVIIAGDDKDIVRGDAGNDYIEGNKGDDEIYGGDGNDEIYGQEGQDKLYGGNNDDILIGGLDKDEIFGEAGRDILFGDSAEVTDSQVASTDTQGDIDTLEGGSEDDILIGGAAGDTLRGQAGRDILFGDHATIIWNATGTPQHIFSTFEGSGGADNLDGNADADIVVGGTGGDSINLNGTNDSAGDILLGDNGEIILASDGITATEISTTAPTQGGKDTIKGGLGNDIILGGSGSGESSAQGGGDDLAGNGGADIILGDGGRIQRNASGVVQRVETKDAAQGGGDTIKGDAAADIILGGTGDDEIEGGSDNADDILLGDNGSIDFTNGAATTIETSDPTQGGKDQITGGLGNDIILGGSGSGENTVQTGGDILFGNEGKDIILGDGGRVLRDISGTVQRIETKDAANGGGDTIEGNDDVDIILGGTGDDDIQGGDDNADDILLGDNGFVVLNHGIATEIATSDPTEGGKDCITGGAGNDIILGGSGSGESSVQGGGDDISGNDGADIILGDGGRVLRDVFGTLQQIETQDPEQGGGDMIRGNEAPDMILGGTGDDDIEGGDDEADDILLGDNGKLVFNESGDTAVDISTSDPTQGGVDRVVGGLGNDIILGGSGGSDIAGHSGDRLYGDRGTDIILGDGGRVQRDASGVTQHIETKDVENGGDDFIDGDADEDVILGGTGNDRINGGSDEADDILLGDNGKVVFDDGSSEANDIFSTDPTYGGQDEITGGLGNDIILGGSGGADVAGVGGDQLFGNEGDDIILGDGGYIKRTETKAIEIIETLFNEGGDDTINGDVGRDRILGGAGSDTIDSGDEADIVIGDQGILDYTLDGNLATLDRIATQDPTIGGNDAIATGLGDDVALGGAEDDSIDGDQGDDILLGDNGQVLFTDGQISRIETTDPDIGGNDAIAGDSGADRILGGAADDDITGGSENDIILGDNGRLNYAEDGNLNTLDRITTTHPTVGGQDSIQGNAGDDIALGGADNDQIAGQLGNDILLGDNGQVIFSNNQAQTIETLAPNQGGQDAIAGGNGDDIALGGAGDDQIQGNRDRDILLGDNGRLDYAADGDLTTLDQIASTAPTIGGNDVIEGNEADDIAIGGAGDDSIMGNQQNDILLGDNGQILLVDNQIDVIETTDPTSGGNDAISGNAGSDIILGGASDDVLHGDEDHDIILGDHGRLDYTFAGDSQVGADSDRTTLDIVQSTHPNQGGRDYIVGGDDQDDIVGGTDNDTIFGDGAFNLFDLNWSLVGAADFNQDGLGDTLWRNRVTGQIAVQIRRANGQHETHSLNAQVLNQSWQIQGVGDLDGDGSADILWRHLPSGQTSAWLMDGLIRRSSGALSFSPDKIWQLDAIGDLNGDGKDELLWRNTSNGQTSVWFMNGLTRQGGGALSFSPDKIWQLDAAGDLNGDGKDELFWRNTSNGQTSVWFMNGSTRQSGGTLSLSPNLIWQLHTASDLNGNGKAELVWRNRSNGVITSWFMNGLTLAGTQPLATANPKSFDPTSRNWQLVGTTTIDQATEIGLLWRNTITGQSLATEIGSADITGNSILNTVTPIWPRVADSAWQLEATADFNGDGHLDQLWRNEQAAQTSLWLMRNSNRVGGSLLQTVPRAWQIQGAGDFDGDGNADILWRNPSTNQLSIWLMDGTTRLNTNILSLMPGSNWQIETVADFNQDGQADVHWRDRTSGTNRIWFMDGFGRIGSGDLGFKVTNLNWQVAAAGDFNGDGYTDLAWRNGQTGQTVMWHLDGNLNIADQSYLLPARADDLILGDHGALYKALPVQQSYVSIHTGASDGGGNDLIYGNEGDDTILGQQGSDFLYGNSGEDDMLGGHNVQGGADAGDTMNGGSEADVMLGDNGRITRRLGINGTWQRYQAPFADVIRDVVRFDDAEAVQGFMQFFGNDVMQGGDGDDIMHGQRGNDNMRGGAGDDEMYGELGNDTMNGDAGQDTMLGDVGIITRAYHANGRPRTNADGSWHRDVTLTDVGTVIGTTNSGAQLPEAAVTADILLLTGAANQSGVSNATIQQIDLEIANNDIVDGGDGNDQVFGQRGNDIVQGGNGQDYAEGNAGNDSVNGGAGDDFLIGDDGLNLASFSTQQPIVQRGFHLIDAAAGVDLNLGTYGTVVLPHLQIAPQMIQGIFSPIALMPTLTRDASPVPTIGNLRRLNGTELTVFASVIPDMTGHSDLLSGNDTIQGADGQDTIVGDNYTNAVPLRSTNGAFNVELDWLTRDVYQLGIGLQDLELGLDYRDRTSAHTFAFGQDAISGGSGLDSIVGDDSFVIGPFSTQSLSLQSSLGQTVTQLRQVIRGFSRSVDRLRTSLSANGSGYQPHTLRIGLDAINGDDGDDKITGDDQLLLAPIVDPLPYQRSTFWNYGFGNQLSSRIQPLRGYNLVVGNDTVNGGNGNDLIEGDYSTILTPIVNAAPHNANQRLVLEQSLDLLITDINAFIRDLHQDTFGINFNQQNQGNSLSAGNDTLRGDDGDDLVLGDTATFILPWVANQIDLSLALQNGNLDSRDEAHNFRHLLPRAYDYLYRQAGVGSTTLGRDLIGGGNDNDILFGLSNIDAIFGQNGNDFIFGGKEADQLNGGSGQNVIRTTNPARQDETAIAPVIDAHLATLLSPAMQSYLREIVQFQNTPALNGKLFGTILN